MDKQDKNKEEKLERLVQNATGTNSSQGGIWSRYLERRSQVVSFDEEGFYRTDTHPLAARILNIALRGYYIIYKR